VKKFLTKASLVLGFTLTALAVNLHAQTVAMNGLGSSAIFLELGLAASSATTATPAGLGATCLWTENTSSVVATDTSTGTSLTDTGNAWVAWTPVGGTCAVASGAATTIYSYLQTDSVVGNRCLFNSTSCTIAFPTTTPASAGLISGSSEVALSSVVAAALNSAAVNTAGTDIRPEDAEFAITRATTACGTAVASGSQYLGLGYTAGTTIDSYFTSSTFNVIPFTLPGTYTVTPLGATPILVVVNSPSATTGFNDGVATTQITNATLAKFLDGTYSYTDQTSSATGTGSAVNVVIREPLSGTYNTLEYNDPNTTVNQTSQDVGVNQPAAQINCSGSAPLSNPMFIETASGGFRERAIGTGQELAEVLDNETSGGVPTGVPTLGSGFWSVANFKGFTSTAAPFAKYLTIDGVDPLYTTTSGSGYVYTGTIPTTATQLESVTLNNVANGSYPIWSMLRLVTASSSAPTAITNLATAAQNFVPTGTTSSRPDFVKTSSLSVVHSHFVPPAGAGQPTSAANGHVGDPTSRCTATELGGDVGGKILTLVADSLFCAEHGVTTGQTGERK